MSNVPEPTDPTPNATDDETTLDEAMAEIHEVEGHIAEPEFADNPPAQRATRSICSQAGALTAGVGLVCQSSFACGVFR